MTPTPRTDMYDPRESNEQLISVARGIASEFEAQGTEARTVDVLRKLANRYEALTLYRRHVEGIE